MLALGQAQSAVIEAVITADQTVRDAKRADAIDKLTNAIDIIAKW